MVDILISQLLGTNHIDLTKGLFIYKQNGNRAMIMEDLMKCQNNNDKSVRNQKSLEVERRQGI